MKYRVLIGPLPARSFDSARLTKSLADPESGFMALSFLSAEQLTADFPKAGFPDLVSGHRVESPNGSVVTYYSLLERQDAGWIAAKTDPR